MIPEQALINDILERNDLPTHVAVRFLGEGWHNKAYEIAGTYILRLAKTAHSLRKMRLYHECVRLRLPKLALSVPVFSRLEAFADTDFFKAYALYPYLPGERVDFDRMTEKSVELCAAFLSALHHTEVPELKDKADFMQRAEKESGEVKEVVLPVLSEEERAFVTTFYDTYFSGSFLSSVTKAFVHSDMTQDNMLQMNGELCGIIDWDNIDYNDPMTDFHAFPPALFERIIDHYPGRNILGDYVRERYYYHKVHRALRSVYWTLASNRYGLHEKERNKLSRAIKNYRDSGL